MPGFIQLLRCVAKAVVKNGGRATASLLPVGDVLYEIAVDAYEEYRNRHGESQLRAELEGLAQAAPDVVRPVAEEAALRETPGQSHEARHSLAVYLAHVPIAVRQSLRRPADPAGVTVSAGLCPRRPEQLVKFLPAALPRFKPGDQPLAADWELVELLGKGGFGEVWKARHLTRSSQKPVALKFCLDPETVHSLRNEAALHDLLDQVRQQGGVYGIVPLLETYLRAEPPCIMYEYIEGGDLTVLTQEMHEEGRLTPEFAARIVQGVAATVAFTHRLDPPLVHRDLKLSNILVRRGEGNRLSLHVADFGIGALVSRQAIQEQASRRTARSQAARGAYTPLYASPQQIEGRPPDPRDDVYALGVIWYQLATGSLNLTAIPPDWRDVAEEHGLDEEQVRLLGSCLASRVEKRLASAAELVDRLAALVGPTADSPEPCLTVGEGKPSCFGRHPEAAPTLPVHSSAVLPSPAERSAPRPGEVVSVPLGQGVEMKLAWIPPGDYLMGSPPDEARRNDDEKRRRVTLTKGFYVGIQPVTQAQWQAVVGGNPSRFKSGDRPVETVSWGDCVDFCKRLGQQTGKRFRLPTEAEWEYACRGGTTSAYHGGADLEALRSVGWCSYDGNQGSARETRPVRLFQPNAWGLYDMHGNVWEWCADWYGNYPEEEKDPLGPHNGSARVLRGGSWYYGPEFCRAARRVRMEPGCRYIDFGCRVVLCPS